MSLHFTDLAVHDPKNRLIRIRNLKTATMRVIYHVVRHINKAIAFAGSALVN